MECVFGIEIIVPTGQKHIRLGENDIYEVLESIMDLEPEEDLETIQMLSPHSRRVDIATKCEAVWREKDLFSFMDKQFELENGKIVLISRPFEELTSVNVKRIPIFWKKELVERIFSWYGTVKSASKEYFRSSSRNNYKHIYNGNWKIKMKIHKAMPSTLIVQQSKFEIYYFGQDQTCWRCGRAHQNADCKVWAYKDYINRFDLEAFPELDPPKNKNATPLIVSAGIAPTEIVSTQSTASSVIESSESVNVSESLIVPVSVAESAPVNVSVSESVIVSAPVTKVTATVSESTNSFTESLVNSFSATVSSVSSMLAPVSQTAVQNELGVVSERSDTSDGEGTIH